DGQIFACMDAEGGIYLRIKGPLAAELERSGAVPFEITNSKTGKTQRMGYWSLPESALDQPSEACRLARLAIKEG
ncbi:MAG: TfoX/Sxy family protein, partial [Pseudomonadota bacterium]